jgi:hypothetical protein
MWRIPLTGGTGVQDTHTRTSVSPASRERSISMSNYPVRIIFEVLDVDLVGVDLPIYIEDTSEAGAQRPMA